MMKRAKAILVFCCILSFLATGLIMADAKGSDRKGRFYFKKTCKPCHVKDAEGGYVTPVSKTMAQWDRYFKKGTHNNKTEKIEEAIPADQVIHIHTYLVNHAADSDQPETCGM